MRQNARSRYPMYPCGAACASRCWRLHSANEALAVPATGRPAGASAVPLKDMETALIRKTVEQCRGNVSEAAKTLGISRATVYRKLGRQVGVSASGADARRIQSAVWKNEVLRRSRSTGSMPVSPMD